jgi:hypothetical protein
MNQKNKRKFTNLIGTGTGEEFRGERSSSFRLISKTLKGADRAW